MLGVVAVAAVVSLILTAPQHWSKATRDSFVQSCATTSGQRSACECIAGQLQKQLSEQEILAEEARLEDGHELTEDTQGKVVLDAALCGVSPS